ncbi:MAG: Ig-like domain-containing protein [Xanthomonadales bacterium]|nr:Ig-like domain-containing protein [Xanthomonadales bacterium]
MEVFIPKVLKSKLRQYLFCCLVFLFPHLLFAEVIPANPGNYKTLLASLEPGDTLQLAPGTYVGGLPISNRHGTAEQLIIISGPETGEAAVFTGNGSRNTVQLDNSSYLTLRYITLDGLGIPYVDAVNSRGPTHHITIENLLIINHGGAYIPNTDHQLTNGIANRGPAWDWIVRNNTIIGAGTGMYFGNSTGRDWPFVGGLIEHNLVLDTLGYNIQFKHMVSRNYGNGNAVPGMPTEDRKTIVRHNVFSKANNASTSGTWARPNLLVGHWPLTGDGSNDIYEIYGNFLYANPAEALFQGEGNIAMYDNLLVNPSGSALNIQPHNDRPRNIRVFHNSIVATGTGIRVSGVDPAPAYDQMVSGNAVFAATPLNLGGTVQQASNITDTFSSADNYLKTPFGDPVAGTLDLYPVTGGALSGAFIDSTLLQVFSDWDRDFNGTERQQGFRGAYVNEGENPGWQLALTIKPEAYTAPPSAPYIIDEPVSVAVTEGEPANFTVLAGGNQLNYQWFLGIDEIPGATGSSYTIAQVLPANNGELYRCRVRNDLGEVFSTNAQLTVVADTIAPLIDGAVVQGPEQVDIIFSEGVTTASAQTIANYQISGAIQVLGATLNVDNKTVHLQTDPLEPDTVYTLTVSDIQDRSAATNTILAGSSVDIEFVPIINFDNGQLPFAWTPLTPSRWSVVMEEGSNALFLNDTEYLPLPTGRLGEHITSPDSYTDFTFSVKAKTKELPGNPNADYALVFAYQDGANYYYMLFNGTQSNTQLFKVVAGERELLETAITGRITDANYHTVAIRRVADSIEVSFDNSVALEVTDSTIPAGKLGLGSFNDSAYFDDIRISAGSGEVSDLIFANQFEL